MTRLGLNCPRRRRSSGRRTGRLRASRPLCLHQRRRSGHSCSEISGALGVSRNRQLTRGSCSMRRGSRAIPARPRLPAACRPKLARSPPPGQRIGRDARRRFRSGLFDVADGLAARVLDGVGISKSAVEENVLSPDQARYRVGKRERCLSLRGRRQCFVMRRKRLCARTSAPSQQNICSWAFSTMRNQLLPRSS